MTIAIREADLERDRDELIRFSRENLTPESDRSRFDWLYLQSPNGPARAWMAVDESGRTVGMAAAFPRSLRIAGSPERGWVLGDFCVSKDYRTLGPALQLQRFSLESLISDEGVICYDFPSPVMMSIYRRLRVPTLGNHVRYVKLLRTDENIQKFVRQKFVAQCLSRIGNWILSVQQLNQSIPNGIELSMQECEFGNEFDAMVSCSTNLHTVTGLRSAEYLNWRYVNHPLKQYCAIVARRQSKLLGYAVFEIDGQQSMLTELHAGELKNTLPGMLRYGARMLREMGINSISAPVLEDCHLIPYLRHAGFYARENVPVIAYASSKGKWNADIGNPRNWLLLYGDRES